MSSAMRDHKIVRRMKNLPGHITRGISKAMGDVIICVRIGRRRRNQHTNSPLQPQVLPQVEDNNNLVVPEEWDFLISFEKQYGMEHPFFYACSFKEMAKLAEQEQKLMFVYLHSPDTPFADMFCEKTLCSELVTKFLDEKFVCWGAFADRGEGLQMVSTLLPNSFPCWAVINPSHSFGITVLQQLEGPLSPPELVEILQRSLGKQGMAIGSDKVQQEEKIQADRRLREEQDIEYHAALQKDQEKVKSLLSRERAQKTVEASNTRNDGKLSKQQNKTNESTNEKQDKGIAMRGSESEATQIRIRFPNGEMREHTFLCTDKIQSVFSYIDSLGLLGIGMYRLISNFPRRVYGVDQMKMTLKDAGLYPNASMFLELVN
ncbi:plant UBX domain-containing protein 10-like [Gastrolobium bilobum]|uniref:plant UBX domain-containing protein 10-like n=1 Tax=Gastrolobium bilobum TaxID=150636 RepID=UPI002AB2597B|nr:plant UBX domain-containing protein 10-like [Gastrolobium bilobum]